RAVEQVFGADQAISRRQVHDPEGLALTSGEMQREELAQQRRCGQYRRAGTKALPHELPRPRNTIRRARFAIHTLFTNIEGIHESSPFIRHVAVRDLWRGG